MSLDLRDVERVCDGSPSSFDRGPADRNVHYLLNTTLSSEQMDPTAPATYRILLAFLDRKEASLRELSREVDVSLGQASHVFRWLEASGFAERGHAEDRTRRGRGREVYLLANPTGLLRAISLFRPMAGLRQFTLSIDLPRKELLSTLSGRPVVFCLGTALEVHSRFYRADEVSFYAFPGRTTRGADAIRRDLSAVREGITRASCYLLPTKLHGRREKELTAGRGGLDALKAHGFLEKTRMGYVTTKVQTVLDLFCDGRAFAARDLLKELWGVEL